MSTSKLWDKVSKTDPAHTKKVSQRGGFTAIDAYHQIHNATQEFGPVGTGWGWSILSYQVHEPFIIVNLEFWHGNKSQHFAVFGCAELMGKRNDADAPKKALTDAITKALSYLGFNADVFLGKFDDSKYVEQRQAQVAADNIKPVLDDIKAADSLEALNLVKKKHRETVMGLDLDSKATVVGLLNARIGEFAPGPETTDG